jgi:hypothetical protein
VKISVIKKKKKANKQLSCMKASYRKTYTPHAVFRPAANLEKYQ